MKHVPEIKPWQTSGHVLAQVSLNFIQQWISDLFLTAIRPVYPYGFFLNFQRFGMKKHPQLIQVEFSTGISY